MNHLGDFAADDPLSPSFQQAIEEVLEDFRTARQAQLAGIDGSLADTAGVVMTAIAEGKRLRPAFLWWGFRGICQTVSDPAGLLRAGASLEWLHAGLLVHDDVIDRSDTRRGHPALHRALAVEGGQVFGEAGAILLGALLMAWSVEAFESSGLPPERLAAARPVLAQMRTEVLAGQLLDLRAQHDLPLWVPGSSLAQERSAEAVASVVADYKAALYTVARPLQAGALLAGGGPEVTAGLLLVGAPLGRAFQFRDDLLDVFGDPVLTGKPTGGDLREGKRTLLVAHALSVASRAQRDRLASVLGRARAEACDLDDARQILIETGARAHVETVIERDYRTALAELARLDLTPVGRAGLRALAARCVERDR